MMIYDRIPQECTKEELKIFKELVSVAGEVISTSLNSLVNRAYKLIFITDNNEIIGIAGVKNPNQSYIEKISKKTSIKISNNMKELGWIYILPEYQGQGLANKLMEYIYKNILNDIECYATTREKNNVMKHLLEKYLFDVSGEKYASENGNYNLELYVK